MAPALGPSSTLRVPCDPSTMLLLPAATGLLSARKSAPLHLRIRRLHDTHDIPNGGSRRRLPLRKQHCQHHSQQPAEETASPPDALPMNPPPTPPTSREAAQKTKPTPPSRGHEGNPLAICSTRPAAEEIFPRWSRTRRENRPPGVVPASGPSPSRGSTERTQQSQCHHRRVVYASRTVDQHFGSRL